MNTRSHAPTGRQLFPAGSIAIAAMLVACASTPPAPTASLQAAQQAIARAEQNEAGRYAPAELAEARVQLASADTAVSERRMPAARQLAEQSSAEAALASARTADIKANAVNDEMKRSTATLVQEMQRNAGAQP